ncbi:hypothetical protein CspeluHIS016_0102770 [Cutaneotrichosporon spelunceum]|uniref:Chromatin modification-related protein n=1 Tax=Cutaneotrichosporon spelunceum TaxID=1672016 RepID=A0AAD3Y7R7_9TREE|nr:hypothetical protein CspeluHIS016_0102770 [Cutaneotrichosporon spelunceum]
MTTTPGLQVHPHFNHEEAAAVASEFVQTLDNLPGEVKFLLMEIQEKDERINNLLNRINQRHYGVTKSIKSLTPTSAPSSANFPLPVPKDTPIPTAHLPAKDAQNISKIQGEWAKIHELQEEKVQLAVRLERIVSRARDRSKAEWTRVGGIDIDATEPVKLGDLGSADVLLPSTGLGSGSNKRSRRPAIPLAAAISSASSGVLSRGSSRGGSPMVTQAPQRSGSAASGRGRGRPKREVLSPDEQDAEGEEDEEPTVEAMEVDPDDQPYCFCQQKSYGEMIGCDSDKCPYEWFHVKCVNIDGALPETWFCPDCVKTLGLASSDGTKASKDRRGRKK